MGKVIDRIIALKIKLPEPKPPVGAYVATKIIGNLLYISGQVSICLLYTSPSPRDISGSRMPSSA